MRNLFRAFALTPARPADSVLHTHNNRYELIVLSPAAHPRVLADFYGDDDEAAVVVAETWRAEHASDPAMAVQLREIGLGYERLIESWGEMPALAMEPGLPFRARLDGTLKQHPRVAFAIGVAALVMAVSLALGTPLHVTAILRF